MKRSVWHLLALALAVLATVGCRSGAVRKEAHELGQTGVLALPALEAANLNGAPLRVVATTSIIGDVVAQVGGEAIALTTLMEPGQDPHSYEPTPQEMAAVSRAHVVFVNGWDLEEALVQDLREVGDEIPIVPVCARIEPLGFGAHQEGEREETEHKVEEQAYQGIDPHAWFSIHNVVQWVENIQQVLSDLDPENAGAYERNALAYRAELEALKTYVETQLAALPAEKRFLVTNHDSLGYLAHAYDLTLLGTVLPGASSLAEPSASDLAALIEVMGAHGLCTLFAESSVSDKLARTVAAELEGCDEVSVLQLYTGAIGPAGSGADSYVGMFRYNVDTIVSGLQ